MSAVKLKCELQQELSTKKLTYRKLQQIRLKQCDSWKALQIIAHRPTYLSQQFEEIMKIKMFSEEGSLTNK